MATKITLIMTDVKIDDMIASISSVESLFRMTSTVLLVLSFVDGMRAVTCLLLFAR